MRGPADPSRRSRREWEGTAVHTARTRSDQGSTAGPQDSSRVANQAALGHVRLVAQRHAANLPASVATGARALSWPQQGHRAGAWYFAAPCRRQMLAASWSGMSTLAWSRRGCRGREVRWRSRWRRDQSRKAPRAARSPRPTMQLMTTFAALLTCLVLGALAIFQGLLALGAPLGRFAWGGRHRVLPLSLRAGGLV